MGNCIFCGKAAGLFHNKHHDRTEKYESGQHQITNLILEAPSSPASIGGLVSRLKQIAEQSFVSESEKKGLSVAAWSAAVENSLHHGVLSEADEKRLVDLKEGLSLSSGDLLQTDAWDRIAKSAVLRDLMNGVIPKRMRFDGNLPLNFQKSEQVVWAFDQCDYLEEKTRRQYVGGSRGVSVRIMKGVYYHVGEFKDARLIEPSGST